MKSGKLEAKFAACRNEDIKHPTGEFGGNIQLPTQFADVGNAGGAHAGIAKFNLPRGAKRMRGVGEISAGHFFEERPAVWPHDAEHRLCGGDIGYHYMGVFRNMAF